jgi:hypothetical protein
MRRLVLSLCLFVAGAASAQAEPIRWCEVNPTSDRMNHSQPECSNAPDPAWDVFDMVELGSAGGADQVISVGPWAEGGADGGCDWDDPPQVVARCLLAPRRQSAFSYLWSLARYCDPAGPAVGGDLAKVAMHCRPVQRVFDALKILTERPTDPALAIPGVTERGVAFAPAPGYVQVQSGGASAGQPYVVFTQPRYVIDISRPLPGFPPHSDHVVALATRGALRLDNSRWEVPYTIGRHTADPGRCRGFTCDRDSYSPDQVQRLDELMRAPVRVDELAYDAANDCYYAELCAAVAQ